jgi:deazaflavin-dependent oxidoreductase (nitroreductase family)
MPCSALSYTLSQNRRIDPLHLRWPQPMAVSIAVLDVEEKDPMATAATRVHVPAWVRLGNLVTTTLLRAGVRLNGHGWPMYLLTVRGRKSGQPRTTPIVVVEQDGPRYLVSPLGLVDWVRNLRVAGQAILTCGRRTEQVHAAELPSSEAALVLKRCLAGNLPSFLRDPFAITADSPVEDIERATVNHPVFLLRNVT